MSCYNELAGQGIGGENSFNKGEEENIDVDGSTKVDNVFIAEARSADSSGEDDSDEEEAGGNIEVELNIIFSIFIFGQSFIDPPVYRVRSFYIQTYSF